MQKKVCIKVLQYYQTSCFDCSASDSSWIFLESFNQLILDVFQKYRQGKAYCSARVIKFWFFSSLHNSNISKLWWKDDIWQHVAGNSEILFGSLMKIILWHGEHDLKACKKQSKLLQHVRTVIQNWYQYFYNN